MCHVKYLNKLVSDMIPNIIFGCQHNISLCTVIVLLRNNNQTIQTQLTKIQE